MSSSDTTRMLVLGVTAVFEPANGYQLRRELLSWQVESWANINPGSIYSMLATLEKQRMLDRHDLAPRVGARPIAVYTVTALGHDELRNLVRSGIETVAPFDQTGLYAALSLFVGLFARRDAVKLLRSRMSALDEKIADVENEIARLNSAPAAPPHVVPLVQLGQGFYRAERSWIESFISRVDAGEFLFTGEPGMEHWQPVPNDPAWAMVKERAAYLAQIGKGA